MAKHRLWGVIHGPWESTPGLTWWNHVEPCGTMENMTEDSSSTSAVTKITCGSLERGKGKTVAGQWIGLGKITGSYSC